MKSEDEIAAGIRIKLKPVFTTCKQGKFCRGQCGSYRAKLNRRGGKKYDTNARCSYCVRWIPKEKVVLSGIYYRCPCCNMRVRTKRQASLSPSEKCSKVIISK